MIALWVVFTFFVGAIPFSVLIGRFVLGVDVRAYGDGNPGATNVLRAGGLKWFIIAILLDGFKACIPVAIAYWISGITGWGIIPIAIAPILGHAFSPFLKLNGGKAVASTFGLWAALTIWEIPTFFGVMLIYWNKSVTVDGWAVILAMLSILIYMILVGKPLVLLMIWFGNFLILAYKHRHDLRKVPSIRRWLPGLEAISC